MNFTSTIFDSSAWILLAVGCFVGGSLAGGMICAWRDLRRARKNKYQESDAHWKDRFAGFNRKSE